MYIRSRSHGDGGGGGGGSNFALYLQTVFAFCLMILPQLATSTVLDKLRDDPDLSQVRI